MTPFIYKNGTLTLSGVNLNELAEEYATPFYVYDTATIKTRVQQLQNALYKTWPHTQKPFLAYAMKANSNKSILELFHSLGCGVDIVSGGEMLRALNAGLPASSIIFSGVGKTDDELRLALRHNIQQINIESSAELERLDEITRDLKTEINIALRFTPDVVSGAHEKTSTGEEENKFGLTDTEIYALYARFQNHPFLKLRGLSMHIGSGVPSLQPFEDAFLKMAEMVQTLRKNGHIVSHVDLGGGLWVSYNNQPEPPVEEYASLIAKIFGNLNLHVALEPGRILIAESSALITRVIYTKEREDKQFVIVDAGMNDLIRPTLYDAHHPILAVSEPSANAKIEERDIVGPVCETGDYFALARELPPLKRGDLVAITHAGAYGTVMSSLYNTRPFCAEIMVENGAARIIRNPQPLEKIWEDEV